MLKLYLKVLVRSMFMLFWDRRKKMTMKNKRNVGGSENAVRKE
jgi:hypothetical protein